MQQHDSVARMQQVSISGADQASAAILGSLDSHHAVLLAAIRAGAVAEADRHREAMKAYEERARERAREHEERARVHEERARGHEERARGRDIEARERAREHEERAKGRDIEARERHLEAMAAIDARHIEAMAAIKEYGERYGERARRLMMHPQALHVLGCAAQARLHAYGV